MRALPEADAEQAHADLPRVRARREQLVRHPGEIGVEGDLEPVCLEEPRPPGNSKTDRLMCAIGEGDLSNDDLADGYAKEQGLVHRQEVLSRFTWNEDVDGQLSGCALYPELSVIADPPMPALPHMRTRDDAVIRGFLLEVEEMASSPVREPAIRHADG